MLWLFTMSSLSSSRSEMLPMKRSSLPSARTAIDRTAMMSHARTRTMAALSAPNNPSWTRITLPCLLQASEQHLLGPAHLRQADVLFRQLYDQGDRVT